MNDEDEIANTPLHYAAQAGHVKTVIFLTEEAADVDAKNQVQPDSIRRSSFFKCVSR